MDTLPYYGRYWKNKVPPGMPATAKTVVEMGDAIELIQSVTANDSVEFQRWAILLAKHESSATLSLPANTFNLLPKEQRNGKARITAWGCYQFNNPAYQDLRRKLRWVPNYKPETEATIPKDSMPWSMTSTQEITLTLARYRQIYLACLAAGFSELQALTITSQSHCTETGAKRLFKAGPDPIKQQETVAAFDKMNRAWYDGHGTKMASAAVTHA